MPAVKAKEKAAAKDCGFFACLARRGFLGPDKVAEHPPKRGPDHGDPQEDEEGGDDGGRHLRAHRPLSPRAAQDESPEQPVHDDHDKSDEDPERALGRGIKRDGHLLAGGYGTGFVPVAVKG